MGHKIYFFNVCTFVTEAAVLSLSKSITFMTDEAMFKGIVFLFLTVSVLMFAQFAQSVQNLIVKMIICRKSVGTAYAYSHK